MFVPTTNRLCVFISIAIFMCTGCEKKSTKKDTPTYQWLVKQGRIGIWLKEKAIFMEVDQEGNENCLLTVQDAIDICEILTVIGQKAWEERDLSKNYNERFLKVNSKNSYSWDIGSESLNILLNEKSDFLQINYSGKEPIPLTIIHISEIVQAIETVLRNAANKALSKS